jgi:hypothetical protein
VLRYRVGDAVAGPSNIALSLADQSNPADVADMSIGGVLRCLIGARQDSLATPDRSVLSVIRAAPVASAAKRRGSSS